MRVAILARVSTEEQSRGWSIDTQVADCTRYAQAQRWEIVTVITEPGDSGTRVLMRGDKYQPRDGIARLIDLAKAQHIDAVLAAWQDRYHRNEYEFETLVRSILWPANVQVWTLDGLLDDSSVTAWRSRKAEALSAEEWSRKISEKVRRGNARLREAGTPTGGLPFGTLRHGQERDPATWPVLVEIFQRAAAGESQAGLAADMRARGIPTRRGGLWWPSTINSILGCRYYLGEIWHNGQYVGSVDHPCRVPPEVWEAAQLHRQRGRPTQRLYLLQGLVVSSEYVYTSPPGKAGLPLDYIGGEYKRGPGYRRRYPGGNYDCALVGTAPPGFLLADELERAVISTLIEYPGNDALLSCTHQQVAAFVADAVSRAEQLQEDLARSAAILRGCERKLRRALDLGSDEALRLADADMSTARQDHDRLARELDRAQSAGDTTHPGVDLDQINLLAECWHGGDLLAVRGLLRGLVRCVDCHADGITVELHNYDKLNSSTPRCNLALRLVI